MFSLRFLNRAKPVQHARLISNFPTLRDSKPKTPNVQESTSTTHSVNPSVMGPRMLTPQARDKKILVWMKVYKSVDEIPEKITYEAMERAQNWFRIRLANYMMAATILGTLVVVWYGKKRAERGESLQQMNIDWHEKINEQFENENTAKAAAEK